MKNPSLILSKKKKSAKYFYIINDKIHTKNELKDFDAILSSFLKLFCNFESFKSYISSGASTPSRRKASFKTIAVALASAKRA